MSGYITLKMDTDSSTDGENDDKLLSWPSAVRIWMISNRWKLLACGGIVFLFVIVMIVSASVGLFSRNKTTDESLNGVVASTANPKMTVGPNETSVSLVDLDMINDCKHRSSEGSSGYVSPAADENECKVEFKGDRVAYSFVKIGKVSKYIDSLSSTIKFCRDEGMETDLILNDEVELIIPRESHIYMIVPHLAKNNMYVKMEEERNKELETCTYRSHPCDATLDGKKYESCEILDINQQEKLCVTYVYLDDVGHYKIFSVGEESTEDAGRPLTETRLMKPIFNGTIYELEVLDMTVSPDVSVQVAHTKLAWTETELGYRLRVKIFKF